MCRGGNDKVHKVKKKKEEGHEPTSIRVGQFFIITIFFNIRAEVMKSNVFRYMVLVI